MLLANISLVACDNQCGLKQKSLKRIDFFSSKLNASSTDMSLVGKVINDVINVFYIEQHENFEFVTFGPTTNHLKDAINEVIL